MAAPRTRGGAAGTRLPPSGLAAALQALQEQDTGILRAEWQRLHGAPAPACLSRGLLLRAIAYRLQAQAQGGLSPAAQRRLAEAARPGGASGTGPSPPALRLKPGASLVRAWHGRTHTVQVLADGFEHEGRRYASLSQVARRITGTHWSGPRFFGLRRATRRAGDG